MDIKKIEENDVLFLLLDQAGRAIIRRMQARLVNSGHNVTVEQWMILLLLWLQEGVSQQYIADFIGKDKGTISPQIDGLERRGLVTRRIDSHDRRQKLVFLTPVGRELQDELIPIGIENMVEAQQGIDPQALATCKQVLRDLCINLNKPQQKNDIQQPCP
jgi:MarR family transcriptional regulator, organic hydroperoxide resistance regulator